MDQMLRQQPAGLLTPSASSWRDALPVLSGTRVTLREIRISDAPALLDVMQTPELSRFLATPPASDEAFQAFIQWYRANALEGDTPASRCLWTGQMFPWDCSRYARPSRAL
jgi:RimJ/RimL family protein N-acetyltransferase